MSETAYWISVGAAGTVLGTYVLSFNKWAYSFWSGLSLRSKNTIIIATTGILMLIVEPARDATNKAISQPDSNSPEKIASGREDEQLNGGRPKDNRLTK